MDKEQIYLQMEIRILDHIDMVNLMALGNICGQMVVNIQVSLKMD